MLILHFSSGSSNREILINYSGYPELDSDIGPSELSDIAEEPEEGLTSEEGSTSSRGSTPKVVASSAASVTSSSSGSTTSLTRWSNGSLYTTSQTKPVTSTCVTTSVTTTASASTTKVHINGSNPTSTKAKLKIRIFVALFDYDPPTMSPNPDACDEELPFREGQLIKVYGDKDADGFYWGEASGLKGYVPCNMVSEVQVDDERVAEELFKEQSTIGNKVKVTTSGSSTSSLVDDRWGDIYEDMPAKRKLALYDYDPVELSPNVDAEVELSFRAGDIVLVCKLSSLESIIKLVPNQHFYIADGEMDDDGFYMGELNGRRGLVPSNFLTDVPSGYIFMDASSHGGNNFPAAFRTANSNQQQPRILGTQRRW